MNTNDRRKKQCKLETNSYKHDYLCGLRSEIKGFEGMSIEKYQITANSDQKVFDFVSIGPNGKFHKRVVFAKTSYESVFSLNLADFDQNSGYLDYYSISDNGDKDKILATVVSCLYAFFNEYPNVYVYATGSTPVRTRLYRMGMSKYYDLMEADFNVFGELEDDWERFEKNKSYKAFMVSIKQ